MIKTELNVIKLFVPNGIKSTSLNILIIISDTNEQNYLIDSIQRKKEQSKIITNHSLQNEEKDYFDTINGIQNEKL